MTYVKNIFRKPLMMLPVLAAIGFMLTASLGSSVTAESHNVPPEALLPDISPGIPKHLNIHNQQQNEYLRFTNVWANVGVGALEFEEGIPQGSTQNAFQNLYDDAANFGDITKNIWHEPVSDFTFHPTHNHWHIDDIGEFSVRVDDNGSPGTIAPGAASVKVGFCIVDVFKYNGDESPTSQRIYWDCELDLQGIQPGWVDQYHQSVEGNEIDITSLADGTYFLVHEWNPAGVFVDADDTNDESWIKFDLSQNNNGNSNRKIIILEEFATECQPDGSTPGICGEINKNS